jgi:hypothetical protein
MYVTTLPFDLTAWCRRMSPGAYPLPAKTAAELLGVSPSGYYAIEKRNRATGRAAATLVKLAEALEREKTRQPRAADIHQARTA